VKVLILGGTKFLGRHLVDAARERRHEITLFNRGQTNPNLFPELETLIGDRDGNLAALKGRRWDAVIDTSGRIPRVVKASATLLADAAEHYTFLSSVSVYADRSVHGIYENAPAAQLPDKNSEDVDAHYPALKATCEQEVNEAMKGRALNVRGGLLVGPYDDTGRFAYWPRRIAQGGEVLAPGKPDRPVQFIHARDLADWIVKMVENRRTGTYNATGPEHALTMGQFLETCRAVTGADARFVWTDESFLLDHEVIAFSELPLWLRTVSEGMLAVNTEKALAAGLTFRSLAATIKETVAWDAERSADTDEYSQRLYKNIGQKAGLTPEREAMLLAEWRERNAVS
jgi:2'-hydroxyisoflavone reductase